MNIYFFIQKLKFFLFASKAWPDSLIKLLIKTLLVPIELIDSKLPANGTFIDIGCGFGITSSLVAFCRQDVKVYGIDKFTFPSWQKLKKNRLNLQFQKLNLFSIKEIKHYDLVYCCDVLHHVKYLKQRLFLENIRKLLAKDGMFLLKEVDIDHTFDREFTSFWDKKLYPNEPLDFRSNNDLKNLIERSGFTIFQSYKMFSLWPASQTVILSEADKVNTHKKEAIINFSKKFKNVAFITGGTGFLGSNLITELLQNKYSTWGIIVLVRSKKDLEKFKNERLFNVWADLFEFDRYRDVLTVATHVFHLAAEVNIKNSSSLIANNYISTELLVRELNRITKKPRLIFASTVGVFDRNKNDNCKKPLTECSKHSPITMYGKTKLEAERYIVKNYNNYTILRIPWAYGPYMLSKTHVRFIFEFAERNIFFRKLRFPAKYNFVDSKFVANAMLDSAINKKAQNESFLLGYGANISLGQLVGEYLSFELTDFPWINFNRKITYIFNRIRYLLPFQIQGLFWDLITVDHNKFTRIIGTVPLNSRRQNLYKLKIWMKNKTLTKDLPITVITGSSSGLGFALAKMYLLKGHFVLGIDKNESNISGDSFYYHFKYDLSKNNLSKELDSYLNKNSYFLEILINCAGVGFKNLIKNNIEEINSTEININILALKNLTDYALRQPERQGLIRQVINIGSTSAFQPLPSMANYCATKSFVHIYTLSLQGETIIHNKQNRLIIRCVVPSGIDTNFQNSGNIKKLKSEKLMSPDQVAKKILLKKPKNFGLEFISQRGIIMYIVSRFLPLKIQIFIWSMLMLKLR